MAFRPVADDDHGVVRWVLGGVAILLFVVLLVVAVATDDDRGGDSESLGAMVTIDGG